MLLVLPVALLGAAGAPAQTTSPPTVTVDPNSPSGTEYDIPVERARRQSEGKKHKSVKPGSQSAPLFGQGIQSQSGTSTNESTTPADTSQADAAKKAAAAKKRKAAAAAKKRKKLKNAKAAAAAAKAKAAAQKAAADKADKAKEAERTAAEADRVGSGSGPAAAAALGGGVLLIAGIGGWLLRRRSS